MFLELYNVKQMGTLVVGRCPTRNQNQTNTKHIMSTIFRTGQYLEATCEAQGLKLGSLYKVIDYEMYSTPFGNVVTYQVAEATEIDESDFGYDCGTEVQEVLGEPLWIGNAHSFLKNADTVGAH